MAQKMQEIFPDFFTKRHLKFCLLYRIKAIFVLNDTVLDHEFDQKFTQAFIDVWLSDKSSFIKLQPQLLGKEKPAHDSKEFQHQPASEPFDEENTMPELPPNYDFKQDAKDK